ncbi:MAG TPA: LicD family protein [Ohtaekwangia sp.]|nr:LicD family protein [Ohtaekwangia sp.]
MAGTVPLTGKMVAIAEKMLLDTAEILESAQIPYVLEAGTLLGIVREDRLLPWDTDMDITITSNFASALLSVRKKFWLKGYRTRIKYYKKDTGPFKKGMPRILKIQTRKYFLLKGVTLMDIFIKELINEEYYWTVGVKNPVLKAAPRKFYENFTSYNFRGKMYSVPQDYVGYLEYHYGDWKTPKKTWDYRLDDNCVKKIL